MGGKKRKPVYVAHETVYRRMRSQGVRSWGERGGYPELEAGTKRFLSDVLEQPWVAKRGRAIELGCGTAPILRWLHAKGWRGRGVDASRSAIAMAREQSRGTGLSFTVGDATDLEGVPPGSVDLAIDGECLHCLVQERDRSAFFREARRILKPGGCLVVRTMTLPILRGPYRKKHGVIRGGTIYREASDSREYEGARRIRGRWFVPQRFIEPWRAALSRMSSSGFEPRLFRLNVCTEADPISYLCVAAVRA